MTTLTIADYLKYANLQMAAEALYGFDATVSNANLLPGDPYAGAILSSNLTTGNLHASQFTTTEVELSKLTSEWVVVEHISNTATGFSGTLFKNPATNEYVLSFRSTEFIDDAARDNEATNKLEIADHGFAFGQLDDMRQWYESLKSRIDGPLTVTGYSLGGHLATAFNLMYSGAAQQVVTFNGAGVGKIGDGSTAETQQLGAMLDRFHALRAQTSLADQLQTELGRAAYQAIKDQLACMIAPDDSLRDLLVSLLPDRLGADYLLLDDALKRAIAVAKEAERAPTLDAGGGDGPQNPADIPHSSIAAESIDYQLAVLITAKEYNTSALSIFAGLGNTFFDKTYGEEKLLNQFDLVGTEMDGTRLAAMVANSQVHYGQDVQLFIEDQPGYRGTAPSDAAFTSLANASFKLLVSGYANNDFGDTHSLVLIIDSLNVQNTLLQLVPETQWEPAASSLNTILQNASYYQAAYQSGTQGKAEGDVLENVVNALSDLFLGPNRTRLVGSLDGNTWAKLNDGSNYTGREAFYKRLSDIVNSDAYKTFKGSLSLQSSTINLATAARSDFFAYAALFSLSPFVLTAPNSFTSSQFESAFASAWGGTTYQDWFSDRSAVAANQSATTVTDQWLKDRAEFLARKNWFGQQNLDPYNPAFRIEDEINNPVGNLHPYRTDNTLYWDVASAYKIAQGFSTDAPYNNIQHFYFGGTGDDTHVGGGVEDHLYGGGGIDILQGMGGNDWLEGNADDDILDGGDGNDTLIGGFGNDTLIGGTGTDRYVVSGNDTIRDADGLGAIVDRSGRLIAGVIEERADGSYVFLLDPAIGVSKDTNLTLSLADGSQVVIENFQTGQLGLNIARHATGDATALTITGDLKPADTDPTTEGLQIGYDALGNLIVSGEVQEGRNDVLYDSTGADLILGLAGNDIIHAVNGGDNRIEGGAGMDRIDGGADADLVIGGADVDTIYGGAGNDRLYADELVDLDTAIAQGRTGPGSGAGETLDGGFGDDIVIGGTGNDVLSGGGGVDVLVGGAGEDTIDAGDDADLVFGGAGRDMITAGSGADLVQGGEEADIVNGGAGDDRLYADEVVDEQVAIARGDSETGTGNQGDWLNGGLGDDFVIGGDDNDVLFGGGGNDLIIGGAGDDVINAGDDYTAMAFSWTVSTTSNPFDRIWWPPNIENVGSDAGGADTVYGGNGNDFLIGLQGNDYLDGGADNDTLAGCDGDDQLFGGAGNDRMTGDYGRYVYDSGGGVVVQGNDYLDGEEGDDWLQGEAGNDDLFGGAGNDSLYGDASYLDSTQHGADHLEGEDGDDWLLGQGGNDELFGGAGKDTLYGDAKDLDGAAHGADYLDGGDGDDLMLGQGGNDVLYGGAGNDTMHGDDDGLALTYHDNDELHGDAGNDYLVGGGGNDTLFGGNDQDTLYGGDGDDYLAGNDGADILSGDAGNDTMSGGDGTDRLFGFAGDDVLDGGNGNDELVGDDGADSLSGGGGDDLLLGMVGNDNLDGGAGNDQLWGGDGVDTLSGGGGNDRLYGQAQNDVIDGGAGVDDLFGGEGDDQLSGGGDGDVLYGQNGNDTLDGGAGDDALYGDHGTDTYRFGRGHGQDSIYNFDGNYSGYSGTGVLQFNADVTPGDVFASRQGNDLVLAIKDTADAVTIRNYYVVTYSYFNGYTSTNYYGNQVAQVKFADGTIWTSSSMPAYFSGSAGADNIVGTANADWFVKSLGSDTIYGAAGSDTYEWGRHAGRDVISDSGYGSNTILVDSSVAPSDVTTRVVGNDLVLGIKDSPDELTIVQGASYARGVFRIQFASDGTVWQDADIFLAPTEQNDELIGTASNETIYGLAGDDLIIGGDGRDSIYGGAGNDDIRLYNSGSPANGGTADGGDGNDIITSGGTGGAYLKGGAGDDTYIISGSNDIVFENPDEGSDTILSGGFAFALPDNVENLTITNAATYGTRVGTGNSLDNVLTGNGGADQLVGGAGNDTLDGAGGADTLDGGTGDDTYCFGRGAGQDTIVGEVDGSGTLDSILIAADVLPSAVRVFRDGNDLILRIPETEWSFDQLRVSDYYTTNGNIEQIRFLADSTIWIAADIESLALNTPSYGDDSLLGTGADDAINSLDGNDTIQGLAGNDTLDGGYGSDVLVGGAGNDVYVVDSAADSVVENPDEGADTVNSSVTLTLAANVEALTLTGFSAINGTGNSLDNTLIGNSAANTLSGGGGNDTLDGGAGIDTLIGGAGNDTYVVDVLGDVVVESANEGTDTVQTSLAYTLGANLENLLLTGAGNISGTGNSLANVLTGNSGNNVLDGGSGADTLQGGLGDDNYIVDNEGDRVVEDIGAGIDTVQSSVTYALSTNTENLTLTGSAAINGTGNSLNNVLTGNSANNVLTGGEGDDTYFITSGDTVVEVVNEGVDSIVVGATYTLGANVENLTLTGASRIKGTGNALNNVIIGNVANNVLTGGAGDDRLEGGGGTDTLVGGVGNDYYVIDDARDACTENANEGVDTVQVSFTYTLGANLENLVLAPNALIDGTGNAANNVITGNELNNVLNGAVGADTLIGGGGNDTFVVDNVNDVVIENAGQGTDTVQSTVSYVLAADVENLTLTGTGAINGTGNSLNNVLTGNSAANVLAGGAGDDVYVLGAGDTVVEYANEGIDTIQSALTLALGNNIENLTLVGTAAINATGNSLDNVLTGNAAANVMAGGAGNDTYVVGSGDTVVENAGEGIDLVMSSVTFTLGANVENLTLTGASAINGTGNNLDNVLTGNGAANVLAGGGGNDTYVVGSGDTVVEAANQGVDTVQSTVSFTLGANLENLVLAGIDDINGTGNALDNIITGNDGANLLDGGTGNDLLVGGLGNDTYVVDSAGDVIVENAGEGTDTVQSYFSFISGGSIENISLIGTLSIDATGDAGNNWLTGNAAANVLTGLAGNDVLNGGGGADILIGGVGDDTYVYTAGAILLEEVNEGIDWVQSSVSVTLGANLEYLTLTGAAAINGTGNELGNVISGNTGNNLLDGAGGVDTLYGGDGNDTLIGGNGDILDGGAGDDTYRITEGASIKEAYGGGVDTIESDTSISLVDSYYWDNSVGYYHYVGNIENGTLAGTSNASIEGNESSNVLTGNSGNNRLKGGYIAGGAADTLKGGQGNDTYRLFNSSDVVIENASEGIDTVEWYGAGDITLAANVENLIVGRNESFGNFAATGAGIGNSLNNEISSMVGNYSNVLYGMGGDDTLDGGQGVDTLFGGTGNDTFKVDNAADTVVEYLNEGVDHVLSSVSYTLAANVENITLTGTAAINATGNGLDNVLTGNSAANVLAGGLGNDTYVIDALDVVVEGVNEGIDTIQSTFSYTLGANVENLTLLGSAALNATGNGASNLIIGNSGNNVLDGAGGVDTIKGGLGNDVYVVDNSADIVVELAGEGVDAVLSSATYALSANVENLTLTGTSTVNGTGNSLNNMLTGNVAANILSGGLGDDTYVINDGLDTIVENANEGTDTVQSSVSYTLGANLENLVLTGNAAMSGVGNSLNNILQGNNAASSLSGGLGDDTYIVGNVSNSIVENVGEGSDTVQASIDYTLGANLENLVLTGNALVGNGNASDNTLIGNASKNVLNGGAGADTMLGGAGDDTYSVDNVADVVVEYAGEGTDTVQSSVSYTLADNVENLTLTGTAAINATGNSLANVLAGNAAINVLSGGLGNDTYIVGNGDIVVEDADGGIDTVQSAETLTLGANLENLTLTGTAAISGFGNGLDNVLVGNSGNNTLAGDSGNDVLDGGSGIDTLIGGLGDDIYVVNSTTDLITENAGEGSDTVKSSVSYSLGGNLENLVLTGTASINGTGNALNNTLSGNSAVNVLAGGAGDDTYVVGSGDVVVENAGGGIDSVLSAETWVLSANVENLTLVGTLAADGIGNQLDNFLVGNAADNWLDGQAGVDTMVGGAGNDTYVVDSAGDVVIEVAAEGIDTVQSAIDYVLGDNVENLNISNGLAVSGTGNGLSNYLTGGVADNVLIGLAGDDTIDGGLGADTLIGGEGNDVYEVDNVGDKVIEVVGEGDDTVRSTVDYTLGNALENLTLLTYGATRGIGNALDNTLIGSSGNNFLDGAAGSDTMRGGAGDDTYVVDNVGDVVSENAYEGVDAVLSSVAFALGQNIENLTLTGSAAINGIGNDANNVLIGNLATNTLVGGLGNDWLDGGAGADTLTGGAGNDTYVVDNAGDVVTEYTYEGVDTVLSSTSFVLGANVENLTLTGVAASSGIGNDADNILIGNAAANFLDGGLGRDTMIGGMGNDTYVVDDLGDWVGEYLAEGIDTVRSSIDYALGVNLENLILTDHGNIGATGNALDNVLVGNDGANTLTGNAGDDLLDGGEANDILIGGSGNDAYLFGRGYGTDIVVENDATVGNADLAQFAAGISQDQLWFRQVGNNLEASIIGTSDKLVLRDWYLGSAYHVEQFRTASGMTLLDSRVDGLVQAMAAFAPPGAGETSLPQAYQTELASVIAASWQ